MEMYFAGNSTMYESIAPWNIHRDFNILLSYVESYGRKGADRIIEKVKEMARDKMEIYYAGDGFPQSCKFIYNSGYSRLLSYTNMKTRAEKYIINKRWDSLREKFELYLAGSTRGFPDMVPEKLIKEYSILLSYMHPVGPKGVDLTIEMMKEEFMDLYLVGPEKENIMEDVTGGNKSNILFNYLTGKNATEKYKEAIKPKKLFIDSGAYSAWTQGKEIDVDEYIDWINERTEFIDLYAQVDVIPGDKDLGATQEQVAEAGQATWENYLYMRDKMKEPEKLLYTFHVGEPYEYLERALEWKDENGKHIPYIALGGMVGKPMPVKKSFLRICFDIIKKSSNPNVKTHAFGMTSFDLLSQYPITSADSTSWIMTGANGAIMTDVGTIEVSDKLSHKISHYSHLPKSIQEEFEKSIKEYGFTLEELRESRDCRIMHNARYMNKKADELVYIPRAKQKSLF